MADGALGVALALWRQPSLRPALRAQPLPDDVAALIDLAAGATGRVAHAAAQMGECTEVMLDATRFYLREVVMHDERNAYRTLGVVAHAPDTQLKAHHRMLQHWLHPDRRGPDDDAVYATRINTAWSLLRTPERRAAYDAVQHSCDPATPVEARRVLVTGWRADHAQPRRRRDLVLLASAGVFCVWLLVLAGRQALSPAPDWEPMLREDAQAIESLTAMATTAVGASAADSAAGRQSSAALAPDGASDGASVGGAVPVVVHGNENFQRDPASPASRLQDTDVAAEASIQATDSPRPDPLIETRVGAARATTDIAALVEIDDAPSGSLSRSTLPSVLPNAPPSIGLTATPAAAPRSGATVERPVSAAGGAAAARETATTPVADGPRVLAALHRGEQLTAFLHGESVRAPPIWSSASTLDSAEAARGRFSRSRSRAALRVGDPDWRVAATRATMVAPVRAGGDLAGQLQVELAWRNDTWLVDRLQLDAPMASAQ